jgi:hypothetical protein
MSTKQTSDTPRVISTRVRPRFGRISAAVEYSGLGRSVLYIKAAERPGLFRKNGTANLVDFDILDQVLDELPAAKIKPPSAKKPRAA